jgi:hypothetical protein
MAAFLVSILFQLLLLCLHHVLPCVSLSMSPLGILRSCRQRLFPSSSRSNSATSSTHSLALLFEAYDVIQDPLFRSTSTSTAEAWKIFESIVSDVEATKEGVVAGQGLVAKRDFQAGEVVALYPIHALGYANGMDPSITHEPSKRRFPSLSSRMVNVSMDNIMEEPGVTPGSADTNIIVGTSDLVCFKDEARQFGVKVAATSTEEEYEQPVPVPLDYTYTMLDPSERYVFDVNPSRTVSSSMFVAHLVNDAAAADFSATSDADFDEMVRTVVAYLDDSLANFNVVMTPFGPPPLMAYVTVKPVKAGTELLATYGLDYWLGKVGENNSNDDDDGDEDDDDDDVQDVLRRRLEDIPRVRQKIDRADDIVASALKAAKKAVRSKRYKRHTDLMEKAVADLMAVEAVAAVAPQGNRIRSRWWHRILPKGGAGLDWTD